MKRPPVLAEPGSQLLAHRGRFRMTPIVPPDPLVAWMDLSLEERRFRLRKKKITPETPKAYRRPNQSEREIMFQSQGSCCCICKTRKPGSRKGWHTDHCHRERKVRAILCHHCNLMLGFSRDNITNLMEAAKYLLKISEPDSVLYWRVKNAK